MEGDLIDRKRQLLLTAGQLPIMSELDVSLNAVRIAHGEGSRCDLGEVRKNSGAHRVCVPGWTRTQAPQEPQGEADQREFVEQRLAFSCWWLRRTELQSSGSNLHQTLEPVDLLVGACFGAGKNLSRMPGAALPPFLERRRPGLPFMRPVL